MKDAFVCSVRQLVPLEFDTFLVRSTPWQYTRFM